MSNESECAAGAVRRGASSLLCAAILGCTGSGEGLDSNGRPLGEAGPPGGQNDFQRIQDTIFTPVCTACHAGAAAPLGLRLDAGNSFAQLVGVPSVQVPALRRVAPGDPANSYLVQKIEGRAAVGARMPLGGPPLPQASIDLIRQWIAAGAQLATVVDDSTSFVVRSTIPGPDELAPSAPTEIVTVFSHEVDSSLANAGAFELLASGGDGGFAEGNEIVVGIAKLRVSVGNSSVVALEPYRPLRDDTYRLTIRGTGATHLADVLARSLDGDADGEAGGDFSTTFTIESGATP